MEGVGGGWGRVFLKAEAWVFSEKMIALEVLFVVDLGSSWGKLHCMTRDVLVGSPGGSRDWEEGGPWGSRASQPTLQMHLDLKRMDAWRNPARLLICVLVPPSGALWAVDGAGPAESDQVLRGPAAGLGRQRLSGRRALRLEVLVDLGDVLHHALPVGPVRVQHLTELLREKRRGHAGTPRPPTPFPRWGSDPGWGSCCLEALFHLLGQKVQATPKCC